jgi:excisionase family DNA binding protein
MTEEALMTKQEFAKRIGISVRTVNNLMKAGKVRPVKIGTRALFCEHHVTELLDNCDTSKRIPVAARRKL